MEDNGNVNFSKEAARALLLIFLIVIVIVGALSGAAYSNIEQLDQQSRQEQGR